METETHTLTHTHKQAECSSFSSSVNFFLYHLNPELNQSSDGIVSIFDAFRDFVAFQSRHLAQANLFKWNAWLILREEEEEEAKQHYVSVFLSSEIKMHGIMFCDTFPSVYVPSGSQYLLKLLKQEDEILDYLFCFVLFLRISVQVELRFVRMNAMKYISYDSYTSFPSSRVF